jgi:hypothetical protein
MVCAVTPPAISISSHGSVVLTTESARDGSVWGASVVRVQFGP